MRNVALLAVANAGFPTITKRDAFLDWREVTGCYAGADIKLLKDSDPDLSDFDEHIDDACAFLDLDFQHRGSFEQ